MPIMAFLFISLIFWVNTDCRSQVGQHKLISAELLQHMVQKDSTVVLVDVRTKVEYNNGHLINAIHSNFLGLHFVDAFENISTDKTVILYCQTGHRSKYATKKLLKMGYKQVYDLQGGFKEWSLQGLPVTVKSK